jgi:hypothetical protein
MYTHCPFCIRDTVEQNLCVVCYFNFDEINKKSNFSYENKLKYFKTTLKSLSHKIYYDVTNYENGTYREILQQIPVNKRKSFLYIQNLIKLLKNDNKKLTEEMTDVILDYYVLYMNFLYETGVKISNIKFLYFIVNYLNLNYVIYTEVKNEDLIKFEKFKKYINNQ